MCYRVQRTHKKRHIHESCKGRNSKVVAVRPHISKEKEISSVRQGGFFADPMSLQIITRYESLNSHVVMYLHHGYVHFLTVNLKFLCLPLE